MEFEQEFIALIVAEAPKAPLGGRYINVEPIIRADGTPAAGAFSIVFSAFDLRTKVPVALKFLVPGAEGYRLACFFREEKISEALIGRDHIIQLVGERDDLAIRLQHESGLPITMNCPFFALERGKESLDMFLLGRRKPKPLYRRLEVIRDVVKGVNRLHHAGFCHRDLKPDNILLFSGGRAKLADLGTARLLTGDDRLSDDYSLPAGHLLYAAPEMFAGGGNTPSLLCGADWFGVGAIIFEAATNQNLWVSIGLRSREEIRRAVVASGDLTLFGRVMARAAMQYPIPATSDFSAEAWLQSISDETHSKLTSLIRAMCNFDFERRLTQFPTILRRLDICTRLARRDHNLNGQIV